MFQYCREYTQIAARDIADYSYEGEHDEKTSIQVEKYQIGRPGMPPQHQDTITELVSTSLCYRAAQGDVYCLRDAIFPIFVGIPTFRMAFVDYIVCFSYRKLTKISRFPGSCPV